jgi:hypothetical protein
MMAIDVLRTICDGKSSTSGLLWVGGRAKEMACTRSKAHDGMKPVKLSWLVHFDPAMPQRAGHAKERMSSP